jgi:hypothetical protein
VGVYTGRVLKGILVVIEPTHYRPPPQRIGSLQRRHHCSHKPSTTFATKSARSGHYRDRVRRHSVS